MSLYSDEVSRLRMQISQLKKIVCCLRDQIQLLPDTSSENSPTFAEISSRTTPRLVYVIADENHSDATTLYYYDGTTLKFLQTVA